MLFFLQFDKMKLWQLLFSSLGNKIVKPKRKKDRLEVKEFASVQYKGKTLKMLGGSASGWSPKTRPKNKLRLNMKKLLDPRLNVEGVTVLDELSSNEKTEIEKMNPKTKKTAATKVSPCQPAKTKTLVQSAEESNITQFKPKLSTLFSE